jgi:tetratricopeptide (TPR) repeat protein
MEAIMNPRVAHASGIALASLLLIAPAFAQGEGKRVALVIGNNDYTGVTALRNAVNDARLIDKALSEANFRTILKSNATKNDMEDAFADFVGKLGPDDTALFFYAGHGLQIENENLLVPIDFQVADTPVRSKARCFSISQWMDELRRRNPKISIIILDACRSNPVADRLRLTAGLATPVSQMSETKILYSTQPNSVAADNPNGSNSWFTEALAEEIGKPDLELAEIIRRVTRTVKAETSDKQMPFDTGSLSSRFYFHAPEGETGDVSVVAVQAQKWWEAAKVREQREDWKEAIELVGRVLAKKPGGTLENTAKQKLIYLEARRDAQGRFESGDFKAAAAAYDQAYRIDPFSIDSAFQGVNSNLLNDRLDEAVRLLKAIRVRGTSDAIGKANAMLKEIAAVYPDAGKELQAGVPPPPPVKEIFQGIQFGIPDFDAGRRFLSESPVDVGRYHKDLEAAIPAQPAQGAAPVAAAVTIEAHKPGDRDPAPEAGVRPNPDAFHLEVVSTGRTISIVKTGPSDAGYLKLTGPYGETEVALDGYVKSKSVPASLALPAGNYEVRAMEKGKVLYTEQVEIKPLTTRELTIKK